MKLLSLISPFILFFISGCLKHKCSEPEKIPWIQYNDFKIESDTLAYLIINFQDCDGDIGEPSCNNKYNLKLDYLEVINGKDSLIPLAYPFYYCIRELENKSLPLKGEIWVKLSPLFRRPTGSDTFKYRAVLIDRAGHPSNTITTPPIIYR